MQRTLARIIRSFAKSGSAVPYSSVYECAKGFLFQPAFSVSDFPGLLFCHIVKDSLADKVVTYWIDRDHFEAYGEAFRQRTSLSGLVDLAGAVIGTKYRQTPWWKFWEALDHYSAKEWILAIFAVMGAFLGIRDYLAVLIATPDVAISYPDNGRLDVVEGAQFAVPVTVESEVRFAPVEIEFTSAVIQASAGQVHPLSLDQSVLPNLGSGQSQSIKVTGGAPTHIQGARSPDVYSFSIGANAKAGILRRQKHVDGPRREVWVWPSNTVWPPPAVSQAVNKMCELDGVVYVSKPHPRGLLAGFSVAAPRDEITQISVTAAYNSTPTLFRADTGATTTQKLEFQTPPFDKFFQEYRYKIFLYSSGAVTSASCANLSKGLDVTMEEQ
jgi:hypothetical protein